MIYNDFVNSFDKNIPPDGLNQLMQALWWDAKNEWDKAHEIVQNINGNNAAWIHAYLHRKEGDLSNAAYWYRIASKHMPDTGLDNEWEQLSKHFLSI